VFSTAYFPWPVVPNFLRHVHSSQLEISSCSRCCWNSAAAPTKRRALGFRGAWLFLVCVISVHSCRCFPNGYLRLSLWHRVLSRSRPHSEGWSRLFYIVLAHFGIVVLLSWPGSGNGGGWLEKAR